MLLHLPAYTWLYSQHDVAVHTSERYTKKSVRRLIESLGLVPELITYRVCALFPAIVLARLPSILGRKPTRDEAQSDLSLPSRPVNGALLKISSAENSLLRLGLCLPWGSSVLAIGRKR
jgi:hypothetical protein